MKFKKKVYVGLSVDIIHEVHINILKTASKYGDVIVGLLTDEAISSYKNIPYLNYSRRKIIVQTKIEHFKDLQKGKDVILDSGEVCSFEKVTLKPTELLSYAYCFF